MQVSQNSMYVTPVFCFKLSGFCGTLVTIQTFLYRWGATKSVSFTATNKDPLSPLNLEAGASRNTLNVIHTTCTRICESCQQ